jgi:hypothetical protein
MKLLQSRTVTLHSHETGDTVSRKINLCGSTILDRLKDRKFSIKVNFDGVDGFARIHNSATDLIDPAGVYRVSCIYDAGAYSPEHRFVYVIKGSAPSIDR